MIKLYFVNAKNEVREEIKRNQRSQHKQSKPPVPHGKHARIYLVTGSGRYHYSITASFTKNKRGDRRGVAK